MSPGVAETLLFIGGIEIVALLAILILLFGASRLPDLARGLGEGVTEFQNARKEEPEEVTIEGDGESEAERANEVTDGGVVVEQEDPFEYPLESESDE